MWHQTILPALALVGSCTLGVSTVTPQGAFVESRPGEMALPAGFVDEPVVGDLAPNTTGFLVLGEDDLVVWEKAGRVRRWIDGSWCPVPLADVTEEVADWGDHGLHGFAFDPDYAANGFVYLYYVVDRHHLDHFGTPSYDPRANEFGVATIGRVTRYAVFDPSDSATTIDPSTRTVLVGEDATTGVPVCAVTHGIGRLVFGHDESLLFSCGDAFLGIPYQAECVSSGILTPAENVALYRSQLVDASNGKIHRVDPATGDGLPTNPFYDPTAPRSWRSRVWALGLRNPYRFDVRPDETAQAEHPGDPGVLYVGDVGAGRWEELSVVTDGGQNLGWPLYEAYEYQMLLAQVAVPNLHAPNPLAGAGCEPFFLFQDLLVEDSLLPPSWPNPCAPDQQVPGSVPVFVHERPAIAWGHADVFSAPVALVGTYDANGAATSTAIEDPLSPVVGEPFHGNASIGGVWYTGSAFPAPFRDAYFHADFGEGWIKALVFDDEDELQAVHGFTDDAEAVTYLTTGPDSEALYYLRYQDGRSIRRIVYGGNAPPVAVASATPAHGPAPLRVELSAAGSSDPDGGSLELAWDFGEGEPWTPLHAWAETVHVYPSEDVTGTVVSVLRPLAPGFQVRRRSLQALQGGSVLTDGVYPPPGSVLPGAQVRVEVDSPWIGCELSRPREVVALIFQEGVAAGPHGGWLAAPHVEVREEGKWVAVRGLVATPSGGGAPGIGFETFHLSFEPVRTRAVRVREGGTGPGSLTAAELRVIAAPERTGPPGTFRRSRPWTGPPARTGATTVPPAATHVATLEVTDELGATSEASVLVSPDNAPPRVTVLSPSRGETYPVGVPTEIPLEAIVEDEDPPSSLSCEWRIELVHENHEHPESPVETCSGSFTLLPHGELLGDVVFWRFTLEVTDASGLSRSVVREVIPEGDCNLNGIPDPLDLVTGTSEDRNGNGVPDGCERGLELGPFGQAGEAVRRER